jgi:hypothetical protein
MKKSLIVGINKYPIAPLYGCVNDATALHEALKTNSDGSRNFDSRLELNVSSKEELKRLITELFKDDCEIALLYFSGHGLVDTVGGYLITPDYTAHDEGLPMDQILTLVNQSRAKNKIVILDCCHSGAFGSPKVIPSSSLLGEGVVVLTASREDELAMESGGQGIFTKLLLDALEGAAADLIGNVTPGGIYAHIDQSLGAWEQRPIFKTNVSKFISLRKVSPAIELAKLKKLSKYFKTADYIFPLDPSFEDQNTELADTTNVSIFKDLQKFQANGLVIPIDEPFMYFAAMNSTGCKLTVLGRHYWQLANKGHL